MAFFDIAAVGELLIDMLPAGQSPRGNPESRKYLPSSWDKTILCNIGNRWRKALRRHCRLGFMKED